MIMYFYLPVQSRDDVIMESLQASTVLSTSPYRWCNTRKIKILSKSLSFSLFIQLDGAFSATATDLRCWSSSSPLLSFDKNDEFLPKFGIETYIRPSVCFCGHCQTPIRLSSNVAGMCVPYLDYTRRFPSLWCHYCRPSQFSPSSASLRNWCVYGAMLLVYGGATEKSITTTRHYNHTR